jgi:hypothetical protein
MGDDHTHDGAAVFSTTFGAASIMRSNSSVVIGRPRIMLDPFTRFGIVNLGSA